MRGQRGTNVGNSEAEGEKIKRRGSWTCHVTKTRGIPNRVPQERWDYIILPKSVLQARTNTILSSPGWDQYYIEYSMLGLALI